MGEEAEGFIYQNLSVLGVRTVGKYFSLGKCPCKAHILETWNYDLDLECPPKVSCVQRWSWKVIGTWGCYTHQWDPDELIVKLLLGGGAWLEVGHYGCNLNGCVLIPGSSLLYLLPQCHGFNSFLASMLCCFCLGTGLPCTETASKETPLLRVVCVTYCVNDKESD